MEALLENLTRFCEVLAVARSDYVSEWDSRTLHRAFQWADYFQHICGRFGANAPVREALERRLRLANESLSRNFEGYRFLSFEALRRCGETLRLSLLGNPAVSQSLYPRVLAGLEDRASLEDLRRAVGQKAAARVLFEAGAASRSRTPDELPGADPVARTDAALLIQYLNDRQRRLDSSGDRERLVEVALGKLAGSQLWPVLAAVLTDDAGGVAVDLVLSWLLGNGGQLQAFCTCVHCILLTEIASRHPRFRAAYLQVLTEWGESMEYMPSGGRGWMSSLPGLDWGKLLKHFSSLIKGPKAVQEATESTLQTLKAQDGDFNEWGISVWTDLLLALKKI
ncbi:Fanconi anemia group F protein [Latimeria chalumnae]|uniref:FA complementation group F n=1 Tax=Latimeria chalumnae TaxID=7897 RepID=H3A681_LATCH|nr:PREDICTED: Fanconi anemia group F protein [Latimeria chalumnae]|eukprot:XP_006011742.1 PREDICTED: Fanconi anemia group F protein [Latimeria chalumnae]